MAEKPTPAAEPSAPEPTHLVVIEATADYPRGAIVQNVPEIAKSLAGKCRPATQQDLGVAGIMIRKA